MDPLFETMSRYLYGTSQKSQEIRLQLVCYMCSLLFDVQQPISTINDIANLPEQLNPKCYTYGAVRLWVHSINGKKAKHYYYQNPPEMYKHATSFIMKSLGKGYIFDKYTLLHLFGDVYQTEVYIDGIYVQEAAGLPLNYVPSDKRAYFTRGNNGGYSVSVKQQMPLVHKSKRKTIEITKYMLYKCVNSETEYPIGNFTQLSEYVFSCRLQDNIESIILKLHIQKQSEFPLWVFGRTLKKKWIHIKRKSKDFIIKLPPNHCIEILFVVEALSKLDAKQLVKTPMG